MKRFALAAVLAAGAAGPALADHSHHGNGSSSAYQMGSGQLVVTVQCFRGPWREVIWDHPEAVFVDSLVNVGYDYPTAHAIAERVCRDYRLVDDLEGLRDEMYRILRDSPEWRQGLASRG